MKMSEIISYISNCIKNLAESIKLYYSNNKLPESIRPNLTTLNWSSNQLTTLQESIGLCNNLTTLNWSSNQLTTLPESIETLTNLTIFECQFNYLTSLPESIGLLINLTELNCSANELTTLPESIGLLINLTKLYCDDNQLTSLPESIGPSLIVLHCSNNQLTTLPESIGSSLTELYCSNNQLTSLPESIGPSLIVLHCSNNQLTTLPESIGLCINLLGIFCSNNQLTSLPESIGLCINLTYLYCWDNNLTSLPESIGNLTNLTDLYCPNNSLTVLPESIGNLTNLTDLWCHNNNLTTLPAELGNCRRLRICNYSNNPIEFIPINVQRLLNHTKNHQNIYDDNQNVHNHKIQQSIVKSVYNLLNDPLSLVRQLFVKNNTLNTIINSSLSNKTKSALIEYSEDVSVHTVLNISFKELLDYVWQRIENHRDKENILRILEEEMSDAECKCFTGRMSRLVNCLNGFYDDIKIEIGEKEQIGNIIILIKDKLIAEGQYTVTVHKEQVKAALKEREYSDDQINMWIEYIE